MMGSAAQRLIRLYGVRPGTRAVVLTANGDGYGVALDLADAGVAGRRPSSICAQRRRHVAASSRAVSERGVRDHHRLRRRRRRSRRTASATSSASLVARDHRRGHAATTAARIDRLRSRLHVRRLHADRRICCTMSAPSSSTTARRTCSGRVAAAACLRRRLGRRHLRSRRRAGGRPPRRLGGGAGCRPRRRGAEPAAPGRSRRRSASPIPGRSSRTRRARTSSISTRTCRSRTSINGVADGYDDIELLKRYSTVGMGPSQGRHRPSPPCASLAKETGRDLADACSVTTQRPPFVPEKFGHLAGRVFEPERHTAMHHRHLELGAQMMPAGLWLRPAYYGTQGRPRDARSRDEVRAVREQCRPDRRLDPGRPRHPRARRGRVPRPHVHLQPTRSSRSAARATC